MDLNFTAVWERSETDTWKHLNLSPSLKLHLEHTPSSCLPASSSRTVTTSRTTADEEAEVYSWTDRKSPGFRSSILLLHLKETSKRHHHGPGHGSCSRYDASHEWRLVCLLLNGESGKICCLSSLRDEDCPHILPLPVGERKTSS